MKEGTLHLDSYRLAQYAIQVPCYICEEGNSFDAELCRHCYAPMALAHQANSQGVHPRMIATIGPSGVGKTVYMGMLMDMLARQTGDLHMLVRGAFSITLQQSTVSALSRCEFPSKTPNEADRWNWVHAQIRSSKQKRLYELIMPDMAGEAIFEEVDHPRTYPVIQAFLKKCAGVIVMIDAMKLNSGTADEDYFTMKLLSYLLELDDDKKTGWHTRPIALVFSKSDQSEECFLDPAAYAKAHTPGLWQHIQQRFKTFSFYATGVAGSCAFRNSAHDGKVRVPLRVEPRGVIEPFEWLISHLKGK